MVIVSMAGRREQDMFVLCALLVGVASAEASYVSTCTTCEHSNLAQETSSTNGNTASSGVTREKLPLNRTIKSKDDVSIEVKLEPPINNADVSNDVKHEQSIITALDTTTSKVATVPRLQFENGQDPASGKQKTNNDQNFQFSGTELWTGSHAKYSVPRPGTASNVVTVPSHRFENGLDPASDKRIANDDRHFQHAGTKLWTASPAEDSALGPNSTRQHRYTWAALSPDKNSVKIDDTPDSEEENPKSQNVVLISPEISCKAKFEVIQYNTSLREDPVVVEFRMRKDSEFVLNQCFLLLTAQQAMKVVSIVLLEMSCNVRGRVWLIDSSKRWESWSSCVRHVNPGVDWVTEGSKAFLVVNVEGDGLFAAKMNVAAVTKPEPGSIETRYLTSTLGYIQNAGIRLNEVYSYRYKPVQSNTWSHLTVPGLHALLISVAIEGLGSLSPAQVCQRRVELYEGNMNKTVWRLCSRYRSLPQPHISYEGHVHVHFIFGRNDDKLVRGIGFRLIFTFHDISNLPVRLTDGKWNCSTTTRWRLLQHFTCDLIIHCANGEDEKDCPLFAPCGHDGVLRRGDKCYSLIRLEPGTTWHQGNAVCSSLGPGGRLATPSAVRSAEIHHRLRQDLITNSGHVLLFGLSSANTDIHFYANLVQGTGTTIDYTVSSPTRYTFTRKQVYFYCHGFCTSRTWRVLKDSCTKYTCYAFCETQEEKESSLTGNKGTDKSGWDNSDEAAYKVVFPNITRRSHSYHVTCDQGHRAHPFLAFDQQTRCFRKTAPPAEVLCDSAHGWTFPAGASAGSASDDDCRGLVTSLHVPFACGNDAQHVHYTLVCDHRQDCQDNSDEDFCFFPPCDTRKQFQCETKRECQPLHKTCDFQPDCLDASDEDDCESEIVEEGEKLVPTPPFIVNLIGIRGFPLFTQVKAGITTNAFYCPSTHYLCPSDGNCMPIFTRCNGVADCSGREDERDCDSYVCPGLYRCRGLDLNQCVLPTDLCDGALHCLQHDDERFCDLTCPHHCACLGHAFVCRRPFDGRRFQDVRYLDARGSGLKLQGLAENVMLIYLNLARCDVSHLSNVTLPNLYILDLSDNKIPAVGHSDLDRWKSLRDLKLNGNPIIFLFQPLRSDVVWKLRALKTLDLSRVKLQTFSLSVLAPFSSLQLLNLSQSGVKILQKTDQSPSLPKTLRELDARDCDLTEFPRTLFKGLNDLKVVFADTYKLCCPAVLPGGFTFHKCHAPFDEISSCDALLRSSFYRGCLYVLATFGLLGNFISFVARLCVRKSNGRSGFGVFVQHLCVSDFLMGVYLVFIGVADSLFSSNYLWEDTSWRHSAACKLAGFISLASCEVSSFIICLITVDRFVALQFPFSQLRFGFVSAQIASVAAWAAGFTLAAVPLLPAAQAWQFYSQTGICIPLPVTRQEFAGQGYAFGVMIVLNFLLFILIAGGQVSIYASIQASKMSDGETSSKSHDAAIARRLITVAVSDFLCWFPVGLLGLLASSGTPVPGTVNVAMAIFVLPLNSALNPFLYTLNMLQERFQKQKEDKMLKMLMEQKC